MQSLCRFKLLSYICHTKLKPYLQNRETHQIIRNTETSVFFQWRATPSGSIYAGGLQRKGGTQNLSFGVSSRLGYGFFFSKAKNLGCISVKVLRLICM